MTPDGFTERWGKVSLAIISDRRVSASTVRVFAALACHADRAGRCRPAQATLAAIMGVSRQAIGPHIKKLSELGYIAVTKRFRNRGGYASSAYVLNLKATSSSETTAIISPAKADASATQVPLASVKTAHESGPDRGGNATQLLASLPARPVDIKRWLAGLPPAGSA